MEIRHLLPLALLASAAAHSAPLANLVLACPDESAIDQAFDACHGYIYEIPTNERIVVSSSYVWRKAADLAASDLLLVCTIPVEPGAYSSCRDSAGIRRTAFVPKDSVIMGGRNSVIVSKTGGDYSDPVTAAKNAYAGDTWCVAPQWPQHPCVMAIGDGIFILPETLNIPAGLAMSGNGKGDAMLVADNGVETAVSSFNSVRISDLTIVNSQPGGARTTGIDVRTPGGGGLAELHDVAIHVSGAAQNVALVKNLSLEIFDSEITAVGQDTTGIQGLAEINSSNLTLERSHVSAEMAIHEDFFRFGVTMRLVDSHVSGTVFFEPEASLLEIVGTEIVGDVTAWNDFVRVVIAGSSIKGNVDLTKIGSGGMEIRLTDTNVEGRLVAERSANTEFDGLTVHGEFVLEGVTSSVLRSYIVNSTTTAPALSLGSARVQLEQTFVQGTQALAAGVGGGLSSGESRLEASSSVLVGAVSTSAGSVLSCTDTYGADYELLNATCQPQVP